MKRREHSRGLPKWGIGLIAIVAVIFGFYLAFAKSIPFISSKGYELQASSPMPRRCEPTAR